MIEAAMQFVTDFADQSIILPAILLFSLVLLLLGSRHALVVWLGVVAASYGITLALKLGFEACGSPLPHGLLRSPSGHTMAAALLYGGIPVLFGLQARFAVAATLCIVLIIGASRVALHLHTVPEVALGGVIGLAAVLALTHWSGPPPPRLARLPVINRLGVAALVLAPILLLLHAQRSDAESLIQHAARTYFRSLLECRPGVAMPAIKEPGDAAEAATLKLAMLT